MTENKKDQEVHFRILNAVTKLEISKGHLKWKISDVAKEADVTRSLVYYYLGKDKEVILKEAVKFMLESVFNLFEDEPIRVKYRLKIALEQIKRMPYLMVLFVLNRRADNEIGEIIRAGEIELFTLLKKIYPQMSDQQILQLYIMELGAAVHGDLSEDFIDAVFPD
jgi:AcrR family transcriptional regulator